MEENKKKTQRSIWLNIFILFGLCLAVLGLIFLTNWIVENKVKVNSHKFNKDFTSFHLRSLYADQYQIVNTIISAFAFVGLGFSIYLQSKALKKQQEEIALQRDDLKLQTIALKTQAEELKNTRLEIEVQNAFLERQKFENNFFQLLNLHTENVRNTKAFNDKSGPLVFASLYRFFLEDVLGEVINENYNNESIWISGYNDLFNRYQIILSHYFRLLYHVIKYIDQSNIEDKQAYTSIVRATLSSHELVLLMANSLHSNGREKFFPLVKKYSLLENLNRELIGNSKLIELFEN